MSNIGWYPDPGGAPGQYRYWNGTSWSAETTTDPRQALPPTAPPSAPGAGFAPRAKRPVGLWIGLGVAVAVIALIIWAVVRFIPTIAGGDNPWESPTGAATDNFCTAGGSSSSATPVPDKSGRVSGGHLSFPTMGSPWEAPQLDNRVPFGTTAMIQSALDQADYDGQGVGNDWVSSVLVSDLVSGDGFADSKSAATVVLKCVLGTYYSDTVVTSDEISSKAHNVDGHSGWLIETQLSFDVPGLNAKGERVLLLAVQVKPDQYGLFYASVPDTSPDRLPDAREALAKLTVDS